jgi:hypothetical protein
VSTVTVGLDDGDVGNLIGGTNFGRHLLPVGEGYGDVLRAGDHVGIGDDCAVGFVDNAAAQAPLGEHCDHRGLDLSDQRRYIRAGYRGRGLRAGGCRGGAGRARVGRAAACGEKGDRDGEQPQYPNPGPYGRRWVHQLSASLSTQ